MEPSELCNKCTAYLAGDKLTHECKVHTKELHLTMKEEIIAIETAQLAFEKGFNLIQRFGLVSSLYKADGTHTYYTNYGFMYSGLSEGYISAPTQSFLQRWLREERNVHIYIEPVWFSKEYAADDSSVPSAYSPWVVYTQIDEDEEQEYFDTYEEALEAALKFALNLI